MADKNQEWRPPNYPVVRLNYIEWTPVCEFCSTPVVDQQTHTTWHLQLWVALTRIDDMMQKGE